MLTYGTKGVRNERKQRMSKKALAKKKKREAKAAKEPTRIGVFNEAVKVIDKLYMCNQQADVVRALCGFYDVTIVGN